MTERLDADAAQQLAEGVPEWHLVDNASRIERNYTFADFAGAFAFVSQVAEIAESMEHHPDIEFGWGYARLSVQTHSIGGLQKNDFALAKCCDAALLGEGKASDVAQ